LKVLLVNPMTKSVTKDIMPPLGLAWLAAVLEQNSINVSIIDALVERKDAETVAGEIGKACPDIVGIYCGTDMRNDAFQVANNIRKTGSGATIVMGGPHVTFAAEDTLQNVPSVDIIVRGEGEETFAELVKALNSGKELAGIRGVSFRNGKEIIHNLPRPFIEDLDALPTPARHLLPMDKYDFRIPFSRVRATSVLTGRGCPIGCIYCSTSFMWGRRIRVRSPQNVADEIEHIVKEYGIKGVYFFDDTFTFYKKRTMEICDEIIERNLGLTWFCESRVDSVDEELFRKMKQAGCKIIAFGLESGSQKMLDIMKKKISVPQSINAIQLCNKVGIKTKSFFMYGLPGELPEDIESTWRLLYGLNSDIKVTGICKIRPGTELEAMAKEESVLPKGFSWAKEAEVVPKYNQNERLDDEVAGVRAKVRRELFFQPAYILRQLKERNIRLLPHLAKILYLYISMLVKSFWSQGEEKGRQN